MRSPAPTPSPLNSPSSRCALASSDRATLVAFTIADALWVGGSAVALLLFWGQFTPVARSLVIIVALVVEVFAALQYRAAAGTSSARALDVT